MNVRIRWKGFTRLRFEIGRFVERVTAFAGHSPSRSAPRQSEERVGSHTEKAR